MNNYHWVIMITVGYHTELGMPTYSLLITH